MCNSPLLFVRRTQPWALTPSVWGLRSQKSSCQSWKPATLKTTLSLMRKSPVWWRSPIWRRERLKNGSVTPDTTSATPRTAMLLFSMREGAEQAVAVVAALTRPLSLTQATRPLHPPILPTHPLWGRRRHDPRHGIHSRTSPCRSLKRRPQSSWWCWRRALRRAASHQMKIWAAWEQRLNWRAGRSMPGSQRDEKCRLSASPPQILLM